MERRDYVKYPFEHMALFQHYESRARSSGKGLWILSPPQKPGEDEKTVYVTKSGKKYHRKSCRSGGISQCRCLKPASVIHRVPCVRL